MIAITPEDARHRLSAPAASTPPPVDPLQQMERDDRADWELLRLVVGVAAATLILAVASTLVL